MARASIAVLLLPRPVEELEQREAVERLLRGPGVVALEPGRIGFAQGRRTKGQARRLLSRLPGRPVAVVVFGEREQPLGEALAGRVLDCELITARDTEGLRERFARLGVEVG
ncbi:MAG TPA: hypothetical protein VF529_15910 [Solirubrobacteraceae bacterium]|jgi:hypothetical protein